MIVTATNTAPTPKTTKRGTPPWPALVVVALIVILVIGTGVAYLGASGGPTKYACMSISHQGGEVQITTTGLLHYLKQQYYITCTEGSSLPSNVYTSACLTITPQVVLAGIGVGASTNYYYLSAPANAIAVAGAPPLVNGSEIITPSAISLSVRC